MELLAGASARPTNADLQVYLMEARATPFAWGDADCCSFSADWVQRRTGHDPMARWRGKYSTEGEARKYIADAGGLSMLWLLGMIDVGVPEVDFPRIGDVGIVTVLGEHGKEEVGGIFGGRRWFVRSTSGIFSASFDPVMVWRV